MCFLVLYLIAVWGVQVATIVFSFSSFHLDFCCWLYLHTSMAGNFPWWEFKTNSLPMGNNWNNHSRLISCSCVKVLCELIVMVASLSIFALIISFLILLGYGLITYKLTWKQSFLFPLSATSFFSSIGIPSYSLGYNFSFLSFYVSFLFLLLL